jgi:hypothetical protein
MCKPVIAFGNCVDVKHVVHNLHGYLVAQEVTKEENVEVISGHIAQMIDI